MTVWIRADGSVEPSSANVSKLDETTYVLTGNVEDGIVVEKGGIVLDGRGYTVQGRGVGTGMALEKVRNVKIVNVVVKGFQHGIFLEESSNIEVAESMLTDNGRFQEFYCFSYGIYLYSSSNNSITGNRVEDNGCGGIGLYGSSENSIVGNTVLNDEDGIVLEDSSRNNVSKNSIANNVHGILLKRSSGNIIEGNSIEKNSTGIEISEFSGNNSIAGNRIKTVVTVSISLTDPKIIV
ncbi:MAG: NosD domain-containing protein [Thermoproteota archaeon]